MLAGEKPPPAPAAAVAPRLSIASAQGVWLEIQKIPAARVAGERPGGAARGGLIEVPGAGKGPRGIDLSPDGSRLAVAAYYAEKAVLLNPTTGKQSGSVALAPARKPDPVRQGEINFHDATLCFQHWLSCASCHPQGRADGLNWDLLNDGLGNPNNTKSLLLSHRTPPAMWQGARQCRRGDCRRLPLHSFTAHRGGRPPPAPSCAPYALAPTAPPGRADSQAKRGKAIFGAQDTLRLLPWQPLYTDQKLYDVGAPRPAGPRRQVRLALVELWRTALPARWLCHDAQAVIRNNKGDKHGVTSH